MAKKILSILTVLVLTFSLTSCSGKESVNNTSRSSSSVEEQNLATNKKIASDIDAKIAALGEVNLLALDKTAYVEETRAEYDALTSVQKELVTRLDVLIAAETKIEVLKAATAVDAKISALGEVDALTLDKASDVKAARAAYENLTSDERALITKFASLTEAENKVATLQAEADRLAAEQAAARQAEADRIAAEQAAARQAEANRIAAEQAATRKAEADRIAAERAAAEAAQNKDYTVYKTATGSKYHASGCRYLSKSKISIMKSDAIGEGLTPCSVCDP